jgi:hypothetical protein
LLLAPRPRRLAVVTAEGSGEGVGRCVDGKFGDLCERRLAGFRGGFFPRKHGGDVVQGIADGRGERQDLRQCAEQP